MKRRKRSEELINSLNAKKRADKSEQFAIDARYWERRARMLLHTGFRLIAQIDVMKAKKKELGQTLAQLQNELAALKRETRWHEATNEKPAPFSDVIVAGVASGELTMGFWTGERWLLDVDDFAPALWSNVPHPNARGDR